MKILDTFTESLSTLFQSYESFQSWINIDYVATIALIFAVIHVFCTKKFEHRALTSKHHAGFWHFLGEIEIAFGFWAIVMLVIMLFADGYGVTLSYLQQLKYIEPLFVFAIMTVASTKPITSAIRRGLVSIAGENSLRLYMIIMIVAPLMGSLITEPAAMILAVMLIQRYFQTDNLRFKYFTLAILLVNISIGGAGTKYAAVPIIAIADKWGWSSSYIFFHFGWKAMIAVLINASLLLFFRKEINKIKIVDEQKESLSFWTTAGSIGFLALIVMTGHHPEVFIPLFLAFVGFVHAWPQYQDERLKFRSSVLVGFFLWGLIVLGSKQGWWVTPFLEYLSPTWAFVSTIILTAGVDNAALTFLSSLVVGLSDSKKYAIVSGALTGGGLTPIANAPNIIAISVLKDYFPEKHVGIGQLFVAALIPTMVAAFCFWFF